MFASNPTPLPSLERSVWAKTRNDQDVDISLRISAVGYTHHRRLLAKCHIQSSSDGDRDYLGLFLSSNLSFSCPFFPYQSVSFSANCSQFKNFKRCTFSNVCAY
ncbi:unnamed protein product [Lactuca virosa]|uniref:Uncharacterized protein n=1 Tax=Lactuca virosa TaxID=75947 RepID=A0AAU9MU39_9ASTR|nr:unnamed protein product [Lactuca virosa]